MFWNGAFRADVSVAIRTGVADLQGPAAADEAANLTIRRVDLRHVDQRRFLAKPYNAEGLLGQVKDLRGE
jgi:hypothetical protein